MTPLRVDLVPEMQLQRCADHKMIDSNQNLRKRYARQIVQWIAEEATALDDAVALLDGFCRALGDAGLPLWRMSAIVPAIDPSVRGFQLRLAE